MEPSRVEVWAIGAQPFATTPFEGQGVWGATALRPSGSCAVRVGRRGTGEGLGELPVRRLR